MFLTPVLNEMLQLRTLPRFPGALKRERVVNLALLVLLKCRQFEERCSHSLRLVCDLGHMPLKPTWVEVNRKGSCLNFLSFHLGTEVEPFYSQ